MKRAIALIISVMMLFTLAAVPISALDDAEFRDPTEFAMQTVEANPGEDVEVAFTVNGEFEANTLTACVYYDPDSVSVVGKLKKGEVWMDMLMNGGTVVDSTSDIPGKIGFMCIMPTDPFTASGTIYTATFHVSEDVAPGTLLELRIDIEQFTNFPLGGTETPIEFNMTNGAINVINAVSEHTVSFVVDGEQYHSFTGNTGDVIILPEPPEKPGYTFTGWEGMPEDGLIPDEDISVYATWEINSYTITYNVNGEFYAEQTYEYGAAVTAPEYTVPEGHTFSGWNVPETMPAENLVLDAALTVNSYTITYNVNGEFYAEQTYEYGAAVTAPEYTVPEGHTFSGWNVPETMPAENLVLNAALTVNSYTITYNVNGEFYTEQTYEYGAAVTAPEYTVPEGHTFSGWNVPETMPAENLVLNAALTVMTFTVTFVDGVTGETIAQVTVEYGSSAEIPDAPEHSGYVFIAWDGDCSEVTEDMTITAEYMLIGDVDGDGELTLSDALLLLRHVVSLVSLDVDMRIIDINGDGIINCTDALLLLRMAGNV